MDISIKLAEGGKLPQYKTKGASCCDCYARIDNKYGLTIFPHDRKLVPLGFAIELKEGYEAIIRPRSGLTKDGIDVAIGTIDWDYRGEVCACVINDSENRVKIYSGDRVCQMKIQKAEQFNFVLVDELTETERGINGFGSTGVNG